MADVLSPEAFNERFTLYLNAAGKPVQRALREMTPAEVMLALEWAEAETQRLNAEADPARKIGEAVEQERTEEIAHLTEAELVEAMERLEAAANALERDKRLLSAITASMPQWRGTGIPLRQAIRRFWPKGRAA
jgi:hypothetical protein